MTLLPLKTIKSALPAYEAVLWDMDGTLVDSEPLHDLSVKIAGEELGYPVSKEILEKALGVGHPHCFKIIQEHLNMPISFDAWLTRVIARYMDLTAKIVPRENSVDIVKALHARGIKQAVFSNSPRNIVMANVKGFLRFFDNPDDIFTHIVTVDDVSNPKPDPEGYFLLAQKFGLPTEKCLVIEDSPTGLRAGMAAECFTIFWPQRDFKDTLPVQPSLITDNLGALLL